MCDQFKDMITLNLKYFVLPVFQEHNDKYSNMINSVRKSLTSHDRPNK